MLKAHGVEVIFGLCGDTSLPLYDALARLGSIKHVLTRDERHAAYMADGYARVSGKVGVCEGPSGGGATYILPGLVEANESSIPVLAINTDVSVSSRGTLHPDRARSAHADEAAHQVERGARPLGRHPAGLPQGVRGDDHRPPGRGAYRAAVRRAERAGRARRRVGRSDAGLVSFQARRARSVLSSSWRRSSCASAKNPLFICGGGVVLSGAESRADGAGRKALRAGGDHDQRQGLDRRALRALGRRGGLERRHAGDARGGRRGRRHRLRRLPRRLGHHRALAPSRAGQARRIIHIDVDPVGAGHELQGRRAARRRCAALPSWHWKKRWAPA